MKKACMRTIVFVAWLLAALGTASAQRAAQASAPPRSALEIAAPSPATAAALQRIEQYLWNESRLDARSFFRELLLFAWCTRHATDDPSSLEADGTLATVVDAFEGKKLNSPNDVVVRRDGTIWFTDPEYGLKTDPATKAKIDKQPLATCVFQEPDLIERTVRDFLTEDVERIVVDSPAGSFGTRTLASGDFSATGRLPVSTVPSAAVSSWHTASRAVP